MKKKTRMELIIVLIYCIFLNYTRTLLMPYDLSLLKSFHVKYPAPFTFFASFDSRIGILGLLILQFGTVRKKVSSLPTEIPHGEKALQLRSQPRQRAPRPLKEALLAHEHNPHCYPHMKATMFPSSITTWKAWTSLIMTLLSSFCKWRTSQWLAFLLTMGQGQTWYFFLQLYVKWVF